MLRPIWGAATSAHQVEGGNRWNDWWAWEEAGKVSERSGKACDHYRLFREDFHLARSLGHTAHRFSLEWSRLEPAEGEWSEEAFLHYQNVFDALEAEGLEPVVTLHHFTNPLWFSKQGGWMQRDASGKFAAYVERIAKRFGKRVRFWVTINEPLIYIYQGLILGRWPPGKKLMWEAAKVLKELLRAHILAHDILHDHCKDPQCWVSIAHHTMSFAPCRPSLLDRLSIFLRDWFVNRLVYRSLLSGFLFYPGVFCERLPAARTLDYLGVNYYSRDFVRFAGLAGINQLGGTCPKEHHSNKIEAVNDLGWEIYPRGIYEVVLGLRSLKLPILITENGVCTQDDSLRQRFIREHLLQVERARKEKIPIFGYFYWSLVDNFEWAEGFEPRFGIVGVDYTDGSRKVRPSAQTLRESCERVFVNPKS